MQQLQVPIQTLSRDTLVLNDDELGEALVELVRAAVPRRTAPAVATVARPERIDVIGLQPLAAHRIPVNGFIAGLTRAEVGPDVGDARAVGVMGTVQVRNAPDAPSVPMAVVFLEWPDCRWWLWRALVDPGTATIKEGTEVRTRAVDGDAMPVGFGRWWSLGRRTGVKVTIRSRAAADSPHVH
ncbi:MAG: hypothetical protein H6737_25295 [Alphaproteobacteria bacterium]|nr:hypothetical protein [Alphaproteobacteria bacterium]